MSYNTKIYTEQGGSKRVYEAGAELRINDGAIITDDGVQAAAITDVAALTGGESPTEAEFNALAAKFNALLAAVRGVGIIAAA